nr:hypothetical protein [uncultured Flavobacterium sp.]
MKDSEIHEIQKQICNNYGIKFEPCDLHLKVGISLNIIEKNYEMPIHASRLCVENGTNGWYIWAGDYSEDVDFFKPLHASHLEEFCPVFLPYLGLAPGTRVLIAEDGNYVDVWEDLSLL